MRILSMFEYIVSRTDQNIKDTDAAADVGSNVADSNLTEEQALEKFQAAAREYHGEDASEGDLEEFFRTAYFEFLHARGLM